MGPLELAMQSTLDPHFLMHCVGLSMGPIGWGGQVKPTGQSLAVRHEQRPA